MQVTIELATAELDEMQITVEQLEQSVRQALEGGLEIQDGDNDDGKLYLNSVSVEVVLV